MDDHSASIDAKAHRSIRNRLILGYGTFFFLGVGVMALMQAIWTRSPSANDVAGGSVTAREVKSPVSTGAKLDSGAGEFEYIPIPLEEPLDRLPDTAQSVGTTKWFFSGYTPQRLRSFIGSCPLRKEQRTALLDESLWSVSPEGIVVQPSPEV